MAIIDGKIVCSTCRESKTLDGFQPSYAKRGCGQCKSCKYDAKRAYEKRNAEKYNESVRKYRAKKGIEWRRERRARAHERNPLARKHYSLARYGLGIGEFQKMLEQQGHACAICGTKENRDGKSLYVDHDHVTGAVRGLLCRKCNTGLGLLGDGLEGIEKVMKYLKGAMA